MVPTVWLLGCVLAPAQMPARPTVSDWVLVPRLSRTQELVYRGSFTEEARGPRVQFNRAYRLETRLFLLGTPPRGFDVALLTILKARTPAPAVRVRVEPVSSSVRLERLRVDLQGKVSSADPATSLGVPLDGAPTLEYGFFVEAPPGRLRPGQTWQSAELGQPLRLWRLLGMESIGGTSCLKLLGVQQSDNWDRPRADSPAWRRQDTVWVVPRLGLATRVERIIEQREPARREVVQRSTLRYDLESSMNYPGQLSEDRRQEILQALAFRGKAEPLLPSPVKNARPLGALLTKINYHLEHQPPTPYREAIFQTKRHVEAARRGETPPTPIHEAARTPAVIALGQPAPDFVATNFTAGGSARLQHLLGKPLVLVFYHPASVTAAEVLRFAQDLGTTFARQANVVALSVCDDAQAVCKQRTALKLSLPILYGGGLRTSYAIETTPKIVVLDAGGVARGAYLGWGSETPGAVLAELRNWLPARAGPR
jgi:hypothetical protein